jgi:hypothetical protein
MNALFPDTPKRRRAASAEFAEAPHSRIWRSSGGPRLRAAAGSCRRQAAGFVPGSQEPPRYLGRYVGERLRSTWLHLPIAAILVLLFPTLGLAQRVYWEPGHGALGFGKYSELGLVFEDCTPADGGVTLPAVHGLEFGQPSVSQQTSISFGQSSSRTVFSYAVQPTTRADIVIPAFDVRTNRGKIAVGEVRFTVGDATIGQSGVNISDVLTGVLRPAKPSVWAGEVFDVEYQLLISPRFPPRNATTPEWKPPGIFAEPFSDKYDALNTTVGGERRIGARFRTRACATAPGDLKLPPVVQTITLQTADRSSFFSQPRVESFNLSSDEPTVTVRALPSPAPAGFTGAVGDFKLESKIVPQVARVGEPITWTVTLRGTGNWPASPALPEREVSADFQVVQPQARVAMDDGQLFSGSLTEDAVLVPTRAGTYTIGPIPFAWFDTASGQYREEPVPAATLTIEPAVAPAPDPTTPPANETAPGDARPGPNDAARSLPEDLPPPAKLPADPLPLGDTAAAPRKSSWWWWFPLALAPPAATWLALAWWTMARTDPFVARRRAHRELVRLLAPSARMQAAPDRATVERWRTLTARLWMIERATPTTDDLAHALQRRRGAPRPDDWIAVWQETEDAMFAAGRSLPTDWSARALQIARASRVHRESLPVPLRVQYWSPAAVNLIVCAALVLGALHAPAADAGARAYREGNFAAARAAWRVAVTNTPDDWAARNNLALACAQQNDWAEATAHWTAAFLLNPRERSIRANLRLALTHLDGVDPELRRIVEGSWLDRWITAMSPAEWHWLFVAGGALVAVALTVLVTTLYSPDGRRWRTRIGLTLVPFGALASVIGIAGKVLYGPLGDPGAGLVIKAAELHSIPTDLAEQQQTSPISAGAVTVHEGSFLGWERVDTARTDGGWLRNDVVVPFFGAPPKSTQSAGEKL